LQPIGPAVWHVRFRPLLRLNNVAFAAYLEISVRMGRCLASETGVLRPRHANPTSVRAAGGRIGARRGRDSAVVTSVLTHPGWMGVGGGLTAAHDRLHTSAQRPVVISRLAGNNRRCLAAARVIPPGDTAQRRAVLYTDRLSGLIAASAFDASVPSGVSWAIPRARPAAR